MPNYHRRVKTQTKLLKWINLHMYQSESIDLNLINANIKFLEFPSFIM